MLNSCSIGGRLVKDAELRYSNDGKPYITFTLAVDRNYKTEDGERKTDFPDFTYGGSKKACEFHARNLTKGRLLNVEAEYRESQSEKDGKKYYNSFFRVKPNGIHYMDTNWAKRKDEEE